MGIAEIIQCRLLNQQIAGTTCIRPEEVVRTLGAMQAQEYAQSKWSIGLRLSAALDADIENAFTKGNIIRTHILRPTWHFVCPEDIRWMLLISAPRVKAANAFMYRKMELDNKIFKKTNSIIVKALRGAKQLTRTDLAVHLHRKKIIADGIRLGLIMMQAELEGVICSGARKNNQFTYTLLDERAPISNTMRKDEALAELTRRYFNSRGPATLKDFSAWSGLPVTQVRTGLAMVAGEFNHLTLEGADYYFPPNSSTKSLSKQPSSKRNICLLPVYDEYIMGYKDRSFYFDSKHMTNPTPVFTFDNTIIKEGKIIGTWRRTLSKKIIEIECDLLKPLRKTDDKNFVYAVDRFSKFIGLPINIRKY